MMGLTGLNSGMATRDYLSVEEWQLLAFFECEPTVLDPGIPWPYNTFE